MKKILSFMLALLLLVLPLAACSEDEGIDGGALGGNNTEDEKVFQPSEGNTFMDSFEYEYVGKDIMITGFSGSAEKHVVTLPSKIEDTNVTVIGEGAFDNCSNITEVVIPEGVKEIKDHAFAGCDELVKVTIPATLEKIGVAVFSECTKLSAVEGLKTSAVTAIGDYAFFGCSALTVIELPEGLTAIRTATFADCVALNSVRIGDAVTKIEEQAFYGCVALELAALPTSVTELGEGAFGNCDPEKMESLKASISKDMTYPEGVTIDHVFVVVEDAE